GIAAVASIITYAKMANAVYEASPAVGGWARIGFRASGGGLTDAFQGAAFKSGDEVIYAFKGTSQKRDAVADLKLGVGMNTSQYGSAEDFFDDLEVPTGTRVTLCGHSLGGAIAQVIGNRKRV